MGEEGQRLYVGDKDKEGYISWLPVKNDEITNFEYIEQHFNMKLNESIKEYYNSYYFFQLSGWIRDYNINLNTVLPDNEPETFLQRLSNYIEVHDGKTNYIPMGIESNGLVVVLDNITGEVCIEDFELGKFESLSLNLEELILNLTFGN
ncbi:SecY-interacting protein Syd [Paenibacillus xylanexedens]|uniref:SecY-interacting protein Syd n=1 Tax=Paenibacillus xylanexedens TaxID=528191 RepID=UPI00119D19BA|nr:SecY-interacting protein Syd [Paenibacillus xylanexedens]